MKRYVETVVPSNEIIITVIVVVAAVIVNDFGEGRSRLIHGVRGALLHMHLLLSTTTDYYHYHAGGGKQIVSMAIHMHIAPLQPTTGALSRSDEGYRLYVELWL